MNTNKLFVFAIPRIISQFFSATSATGQCDACSPIVFAKHEILQSNLPNMPYYNDPALVKLIVDSNHSAVLSPCTNSFSVLNKSALTCLQHFNSPKTSEDIPSTWSETWGKTPVQSTLKQMISLGLLVPGDYKQTEVCTPVEVPTTLAVWLHITERCNLRCAYCYLSHDNADMSIETGKASIDATFRSAVTHGYREVKFKYTGGEPLLRFAFIKKLHQYAQKLAEQYRLELDGVVLSNGTLLTKKMVKETQELGLRLMISLDNLPTPNPSREGNLPPSPSQVGISASPNLSLQGRGIQRMYPEGRDAAGDAMHAVELALECGLVPDISITVSGRNVEGLPELLDWVLARDLPFSLNFYRPHGNWKLETGNWKFDEEAFIAGMLAAYKVIESNLPQRSLFASLADLANFAAPHLRRCSVGHSYFVFDCEGRVSKCQMQMDKPVTDVHAKDPLALVRNDTCGIQNVTVDEKEGCQDCQWRYWCAGGCPLETYRMTGRYDIKSPNCHIYKALYPEVLRLEGLRLLKYAKEIECG